MLPNMVDGVIGTLWFGISKSTSSIVVFVDWRWECHFSLNREANYLDFRSAVLQICQGEMKRRMVVRDLENANVTEKIHAEVERWRTLRKRTLNVTILQGMYFLLFFWCTALAFDVSHHYVALRQVFLLLHNIRQFVSTFQEIGISRSSFELRKHIKPGSFAPYSLGGAYRGKLPEVGASCFASRKAFEVVKITPGPFKNRCEY